MARSIPLSTLLCCSCLAAPAAPPPAAGTRPASSPSPVAPSAGPPPRGEMSAGPAAPAGNNLLWNGTFDGETLRPWTAMFDQSRQGRAAAVKGELCFTVEDAGLRPGDVVLRQRPLELANGHRYQLRLRAHASAPTRLRARLSKIEAPYTELWSALIPSGPDPQSHSGVFEAMADEPNAELAIELGGALAGRTPLSVCLDEIELNDPQFEVPPERQARPLPEVRVNQVGYRPELSKIAAVVAREAAPLDWELVDAGNKVRARGKTRPFGPDRASGDHLHQVDLSTFTSPGRGYKLRVAGHGESFPFDVGPEVYRRLKYDALSFFYLQRSGIEIEARYAGSPRYARPAGHPEDKSVPCAREAPCAYTVDASGGWYDAGDHGKYLVNGGFSLWMLHNQYELLARAGGAADFADGTMRIPERNNGRPDLLDEARWGLDFMLRMQVPPGQPRAGMAHQKVHGEKWSDLPTLPHQDPIKRFVRPVSTAATWNLAAMAAQGARIWRAFDPKWAARCLAAAEAAFEAAAKNPLMRADRAMDGGGAYGDGDLSDERYWAASELFLTTGKPGYREEMVRSRWHLPRSGLPIAPHIGWDHVEGLAKMSLVVAPGALSETELAEQRRQVVASADGFLAMMAKRGYPVPLASETVYIWGSNASALSAAVVMGVAHHLTKDPRYANGVAATLDYILGRNPMVTSYVAGHGTNAMRNPHHRVWAHQKDPKLPEAPPGALSLGPNTQLQDPYIRKLGKSGCPPQTCYVDNIESYSTNEVAINSNAALAWVAAYLDALGAGSKAVSSR